MFNKDPSVHICPAKFLVLIHIKLVKCLNIRKNTFVEIKAYILFPFSLFEIHSLHMSTYQHKV